MASPGDAPGSGDTALRAEAVAFSGYLLGEEPGSDLIERYVAASRILFSEPAEARDRAVIDFGVRHPRSIGFLDAAAGLVRPSSRLRQKILLMAAVLEATTRFAPEFLPRRRSVPAILTAVVGLGAAAVLRAGLGCVLFLFVGRGRA